MDVCGKFGLCNNSTTIRLSSLDINRKYQIMSAERTSTRYGPAILLTIYTSHAAVARTFLPRRYTELVTSADVSAINSGEIQLALVYRGQEPNTNSFIVDLCPWTV